MAKSLLTLLLALSASVFCFCRQNSGAPSSSEKAPSTQSAAQEQTAAPQGSQKQSVIVLKEQTEVKLKFAQNVSSRAARPGQMIEFVVDEDVVVDGVKVIKKGARSIGYVADSASARGVGKGGSIEIRMEAIRTQGKMVKITGADSLAEKRATGKVVAMTILFGLSGLLAAGGHEVKIPEGTPITAYVAEAVEFSVK